MFARAGHAELVPYDPTLDKGQRPSALIVSKTYWWGRACTPTGWTISSTKRASCSSDQRNRRAAESRKRRASGSSPSEAKNMPVVTRSR